MKRTLLLSALLTVGLQNQALAVDAFVAPKLPSDQSGNAWGGKDPARRRIEAHLANAMSTAFNEDWARSPTPSDVVVAVPVKLVDMEFNQNGDGQKNSTISFEGWKNSNLSKPFNPPLIASLLHFHILGQANNGSDTIVFRFEPQALAQSNSLIVQYRRDDNSISEVTLPLSVGSNRVEWKVPLDLSLEKLTDKKIILVSTDKKKTWYPIWFRIPIRTIGDLKKAPAVNDETFMGSVPKDFLNYSDPNKHFILDHEEVGFIYHPNESTSVEARLASKDASHQFAIPYNIHFNKPGLHDKIPSNIKQPVNLSDPHTYKIVGVGQFWNWTPFSDEAHLFQPLSVHYLCLDKRIPKNEEPDNSGPKDQGVISGANWHRVHLEFSNAGGVSVPLGAAESFFNNLENRSILVGFGSANPAIEPIAAAFGLTDVATFRLVRPGEVFITPNSGTTEDNQQQVDQSTFHTVYSYQEDSPACVEVWTPPCTPNDNLDFACALTPVTFEVTTQNLPQGTKVSFKGLSKFVLNLGSKPAFHHDSVGTSDSNGQPIDMQLVSTGNGKSLWRVIVSMPQSTFIHYDILVNSKSILSGDFSVPVAKELKISKVLP